MKNNSSKRRVVYTCITGGYDDLIEHTHSNPDWDYICFTDDDSLKSDESMWDIVPLKYSQLDNTRNQRWHKIKPHLILNDYEECLYVDANVDIISRDLFDLVDRCADSTKKIALPLHPKRDCVYDELTACIAQSKDDQGIMKEQIEMILETGYPERCGLFATNIIYRRHKDELIVKTMNEWWEIVKGYSKRDQLSFPFVLWKNKLKPQALNITVYDDDSPYVRFRPHLEA